LTNQTSPTGTSPVPPHGTIAIGIDVGGSGIKAAAVDVSSGRLVTERLRVPTPVPSTPEAMVRSMARLVTRIGKAAEGEIESVGVGVPSVVIGGVTRSAANIDPGWVDFDAGQALREALGRPVVVLNDADAAGLAEMRFGAGVGKGGTVIVLTLGTGVGSALFYDGVLVPNLELGHMEIRGRDAERRSAAAARVRRGLSWKAWASDLDEHLHAIEKLFSPRLFILGGGVSKRADKFVPRLTVDAPVLPAVLLNDAGIVGAAMAAAERDRRAEAPAAGG
jgi:polyphosphate glucokinase